MNAKQLEFYKRRLVEMRARLVDEVEQLLEKVPDDLRAPGALSHVPTHPADQATEGIDKEVFLIRNEQQLQASVHAALERIDDGTFGRCQQCGEEISEQRLSAIPYALYCFACAKSMQPS
ncbi:MAG TPA: TraR/DksA family transcriptional regulator [Pirellulales bacterium]|nr:TraR/DksA family transcriptional regulator [Pirellulales bacterium]